MNNYSYRLDTSEHDKKWGSSAICGPRTAHLKKWGQLIPWTQWLRGPWLYLPNAWSQTL